LSANGGTGELRLGPAAGCACGHQSDTAHSGGPSFSPDGSMLAWGTVDGLVMLADLKNVKERLESLGRANR